MNYKKQVLDNVILITVNLSEASLNQSEEFKNFIYDNSSAPGSKLVIDMSNIKYMDSSFIGALVAGLKHILAKSGEMALVNIQDDVLALFELTRLDKVFKIFDTVEEALANLK